MEKDAESSALMQVTFPSFTSRVTAWMQPVKKILVRLRLEYVQIHSISLLYLYTIIKPCPKTTSHNPPVEGNKGLFWRAFYAYMSCEFTSTWALAYCIKAGACYSRFMCQPDKSALAAIKKTLSQSRSAILELKILFTLPSSCTNKWPVEVYCNRVMSEPILCLTFRQHTTDYY